MRHLLIIFGKRKRHGKLRVNEVTYKGYIPYEACVNVCKWALEMKDEKEKK
jgi:hypothetical protein